MVEITRLRLGKLRPLCGTKLHYNLECHTIDLAPSIVPSPLHLRHSMQAQCKFPYWHTLQMPLKDKACVGLLYMTRSTLTLEKAYAIKL